MQASLNKLPGLSFEARAEQNQLNVLRTDIAGFAGPTERGPVNELTRVLGWHDYLEKFGGLTTEPDNTAFAVKGYFDNGGEIAYIIRTLGDTYATALTTWLVGDLDPSISLLGSHAYKVYASSPGTWANDMRVVIGYQRFGLRDTPEIQIKVYRPQAGLVEHHRGLSPSDIVDQLAQKSALIRLEPEVAPAPAVISTPGPLSREWVLTPLAGGGEQAPKRANYEAAISHMLEDPEISLLAFADLFSIDGTEDEIQFLLNTAASRAALLLDRQIIVALSPAQTGFRSIEKWVRDWKETINQGGRRTIAAYHPWIEVEDPLGGIIKPIRKISPVGHVAGAVSRLDRERGAHHTPANTTLNEVIDVAEHFEHFEQADLNKLGINMLRCQPGRGVMVWGGRTLANDRQDPEGLYLAHRRLIHRLVRAVRRVAKPLVFSQNGPSLWLVLVRAATTVLLEAYRSGALKGEKPAEAFRVICDESNNPPELVESGSVICEVKVAPAVPMEFITLRIAFTGDGRLELIEP